MRLPAWLIAVIVAAPQLVSAQADTADGVAALARGDYPRAAAILKPIAESVWRDDTAAQFFMATMYESGLGVPADPLRACALYHRATVNTENPFGAHAERLLRASVHSRGFEWFEDCQLLANTGFDHAFEPVTFDLAPGHWTSWDLKGATVTYDGQSTRFPMQLASRGTVFLPLRHTELATGSSRSIARHFVEVFLWRPADLHVWALEWHPFEIVRGDVVRIDVSSGPLTTVPGEAPPSVQSFDVRGFAAVRVSRDGDAEWSILKGPNVITRGIESDAERRETRERALARNEALKRVDWTHEHDVTRVPSMAYADADGCGGILVFGWTADRAEAIVMRVDRRVIELSTEPATFDLAMPSTGLQVEIHIFATAKRAFPYCTDVIMPPGSGPDRVDETWRAIAGTMTIQLSPPGIRARSPSLYRATLTLTNAVFVNASGVTVRQTRPISLTAVVGFWHG
jgi:hypothetical protein